MMDSSQYSFGFDFNKQFEQAIVDLTMSKYLALDTETTGLKVKDGTDYCIGISVAGRNPLKNNEMFSYYFPIRHSRNNLNDRNKDYLFEHLLSRDEPNPLIMHNAKFDIFSCATVELELVKFFFDTMLMVHMVNENLPSKRLDWLSKNVLKRQGKHKPEIWEQAFKAYGWSPDFPSEIMAIYASGDTEETYYLFERYFPEFLRQGFYSV